MRKRHSKKLAVKNQVLIDKNALIASDAFRNPFTSKVDFIEIPKMSINKNPESKSSCLSKVKKTCKFPKNIKKHEFVFILRSFGFFFDEKIKQVFKIDKENTTFDMYVNLARVFEIKFENSYLVIKEKEDTTYYLLASDNFLETKYGASVPSLNKDSMLLRSIIKKQGKCLNSSTEKTESQHNVITNLFNKELETLKADLRSKIDNYTVAQASPPTNKCNRRFRFFG